MEAWLSDELAQREGDIAVLTNAAIERFRQTDIELPPLKDIGALAERALHAANTAVENATSKALGASPANKLLSLIDGTAPNTFARFKGPPAPESAKVQGLLGFLNEKLDLYEDGQRLPRPKSPWS